jgi:hypothetical protein
MNTSVKKLSQHKQSKLLKIFSVFKTNHIIYPGMIIRQTGLNMKDTYFMLDEIENLQIIEKAYEVYCTKCQKSTGKIYYSLNDVPNEFFCESCENYFEFPNGLLVVYRVIRE